MRLAEAYRRLRTLWRRGRLDRELEEEVSFHLMLETERWERAGLAPSEARRRALLEFGGVERYRVASREARGAGVVEPVLREVLLAGRRLRREWRYSVAVVITLAVAAGAAAAVLALVHGVLLRPLPYPAADRLVRVSHGAPGLDIRGGGITDGLVVHYRALVPSLAELGTHLENAVSVTDGGTAERVDVAMVTPNLLRLVAVGAARGRLFTDDDATASHVIISHELWQRRYGGDPGIIGRSIETNRTARTVIGVLPPAFAFPRPGVDLWYAWGTSADRAALHDLHLGAVGLLRPGASAADVEREMRAALQVLPARFPDVTAGSLAATGLVPRVRSLKESEISSARRPLLLLLLLTGLVVLIACANVANLAALRAERQRREVMIARALGAARSDLLRRFTVEPMLLSAAAAVIGIAVAASVVQARFGFGPESIPRLQEVALAAPVVWSVVGLTVVAGMLAGLVGYVRSGGATRRGGGVPGRLTLSRETQRLQRGLVGVQVALGFVLLACAAVMVQSVSRMQRVERGFSSAGVLSFEVNPPARPYLSYGRASALHARFAEGIRAQPGVTAVEAAVAAPLTARAAYMRETVTGPTREPVSAHVNIVTPGYFDLLRIPLRAGRTFEPRDVIGDMTGVILSAALARSLFRDEPAVGATVRFEGSGAREYRVVGISGDVIGETLTSGPAPAVYFPAIFDTGMDPEFTAGMPYVPREMTILVGTMLPEQSVMPGIRRALAAVDPKIPVVSVRTLDAIVAAASAQERLVLLLLLIAAGAAAYLSAVGLWGVVSYTLNRRAAELALRHALGAAPGSVLRLILRQGLTVAFAGLAAGWLVARALTRSLATVLFEVRATDPLAWAASAALLLAIAAAACWLPARAASRIDPLRALQAD